MPLTKRSWTTRAHDFVVLTHDLDFGSVLAATKGAKPSVVQIRSERVNPALIGNQVVFSPATDGI
jgi:predicted nuclease of predicted toxin-antitoxin system